MSSFDLVREPWIPVTCAGRRVDVSLLDALTRAHDIDALALHDPLQAVALLRQVLLPVVLDVLGAPRQEENWADRWQAGALDKEAIAAYLARHVDRFDLFHPTAPFAQVAGLRTGKDETRPVSLLLPSVATGNNVPLFAARTEGNPPSLSPAEAARAVLATQCWDTAAIKSGAVGDLHVKAGKTTGNPTGPVGQLGVIVPLGSTLAETLLLNMPLIPQGLRPDDRPFWRREPASPAWRVGPPSGLLDLLTWQSRRIRLVPEVDTAGRTVVRRVVLAAGDRLDRIPGYEPHTAWRQVDDPKAGQSQQRPVRHQPGRASWRGLAGLLATDQPTSEKVSSSLLLRQISDLRAAGLLPDDYPLHVLTVGVVYGNQSAVVEDTCVDLIPLPVVALTTDSAVRNLLLEIAGQADQVRVAANRLGDDLRRAAGGEKLPWDKGQRLGDTLIYEFTPVVRRLLGGLQRHPDRALDAQLAWRQSAQRQAIEAVDPALSATPPQAFLGRGKTDKERGKERKEEVVYRLTLAEARYRAAVNQIFGVPSGQQEPAASSPGEAS